MFVENVCLSNHSAFIALCYLKLFVTKSTGRVFAFNIIGTSTDLANFLSRIMLFCTIYSALCVYIVP